MLGADHGKILNRLLLIGAFEASALLGEANRIGDVSNLIVGPSQLKESRGSQLKYGPCTWFLAVRTT